MYTELSSTALLVTFKVSMWSGRKTDRSVEEMVKETYESKRSGSFTKKLVTTESMKSITAIASLARAYHMKMTLPWGDSGARLLPASLYFEYIEEMKELKDKFEKATAEFLDQYDQQIVLAEQALGKLFNKDEYPNKPSIESKFRMSLSVVPVENPDNVKTTALGTYLDEVKQMIRANIEDNLDGAMRSIWVRLRECMFNFSDRLKDPQAIFRDSLLSNIRDTLDVAEQLNVLNEPDLRNAIAYIKNHFYKVNPKDLRNPDNLAERKRLVDIAFDVIPMIEEYI